MDARLHRTSSAGPAADDLAFKIGDLMVSLDQKNEPVEPIRTPNN